MDQLQWLIWQNSKAVDVNVVSKSSQENLAIDGSELSLTGLNVPTTQNQVTWWV